MGRNSNGFRITAKLLSILLALSLIQGIYAQTPQEKLISKYLSILYPTSDYINKTMTDEQRVDFYNKLVFWFRVPMEPYMNGLYSDRITPQYNVFLFPDTCVRIETDSLPDIDKGFTTDEVILGSNKNYIEVTTFGWMQFPYGGYFNWARGSGIYINTGGKTIAAHSRIDLYYYLYKAKGILDVLPFSIGRIQPVLKQVLGKTKSITPEDYALLCTITDENAWPYPGYGYNCLVKCLIGAPGWSNIQQQIRDAGNADNAYYHVLMNIYINDHVGNYDVFSPRYNYMRGEASPAFDDLAYKATKQGGYNVIQFTRAPNSAGGTTFEVCDVRWPYDSTPSTGYNSINGLQDYSLRFAYNKVVQEFRWLSVRDPFDLENNQKAVLLNSVWPEFNDPVDKNVKSPPADFDKNWLPPEGWGPSQAVGNYHITDTFQHWQNTYTDMSPLQIPDLPYGKGNCGRTVSWAINAQGNGNFSATDTKYNVELMNK